MKSFSNSSRGVPFFILVGTRCIVRNCSAVKSGRFLGSSMVSILFRFLSVKPVVVKEHSESTRGRPAHPAACFLRTFGRYYTTMSTRNTKVQRGRRRCGKRHLGDRFLGGIVRLVARDLHRGSQAAPVRTSNSAKL
jgi:hypothetical protein